MSEAESSCPITCWGHAEMDAASTTTPSVTEVKDSLGHMPTKKNKNKKKKENMTLAGERRTG